MQGSPWGFRASARRNPGAFLSGIFFPLGSGRNVLGEGNPSTRKRGFPPSKPSQGKALLPSFAKQNSHTLSSMRVFSVQECFCRFPGVFSHFKSAFFFVSRRRFPSSKAFSRLVRAHFRVSKVFPRLVPAHIRRSKALSLLVTACFCPKCARTLLSRRECGERADAFRFPGANGGNVQAHFTSPARFWEKCKRILLPRRNLGKNAGAPCFPGANPAKTRVFSCQPKQKIIKKSGGFYGNSRQTDQQGHSCHGA